MLLDLVPLARDTRVLAATSRTPEIWKIQVSAGELRRMLSVASVTLVPNLYRPWASVRPPSAPDLYST